jgi:hypothetical protein
MAYSLAAWIGAHQSFLDLIKAETDPPTVKIKSAAGTVLAEATIDEADAAVSATTGALEMGISVQEDSAVTGTAAITDICDGEGVVHCSLPMQSGTAAVPGYAVMNTLNIVGGQMVDVLLVEIAPPAGSVIVE